MVNQFSLDSKYILEEGHIVLSGIQALARLPLDQHRADQRNNLNTATMISGYRGSPLGGIDLTLEQMKHVLDQHHVVFMPGVNEDLAATAVWGSQMANLMGGAKYDGVLGMWYGKGPGVDRSGDAFRHANFVGVGKHGGVLALAGDDPSAKSSTVPSHSEIALYDAMMPVLYPGNVQDILDLGRLGFEMSRYTGSWVGFKIVTDVADAFSSALVTPERINIVRPEFSMNGQPWEPMQNPAIIAPYSLNQEKLIHEGRLEAAKAFAAANNINQIVVNPNEAWLGIIAAGKTYYDVRQALTELGFDEAEMERRGIRLMKLGMISPIEPTIVETFARGLEEIFVVEEKREFMEGFIKQILYHLPDRPRIVGKRDENGDWFVPGSHELDADVIAKLLASRIKGRVELPSMENRIKQLSTPIPSGSISILPRTPYFCSGCPHNRSTKVPEGSMAAGGIGCHTLALLMDRNTAGVTHMGAEGVQWVGMSFFHEMNHMFQNLGDGTFFHSGSTAIRQAVAAGTNVTYKILYNSAVAMTGGQVADGGMPIPELTRLLHAEGVKKIMVISAQPDAFPATANWAPGTTIWYRDRMDEAQKILREIPGVTALIYDQECAANLRRKRSRGIVDAPEQRIFINEAVCEGCGDCGTVSNCLSVQPVETEFGRKTQIHQSSCNKDYTCIEGNCPAFMTVIPGKVAPKAAKPIFKVERDLPEPERVVGGSANIVLMGIGGTGIVTTNQILGTAALLDGKHVTSLDQTGLSQKGGPVVSNLKISDEPILASNKVGTAQADAFLAFDVLTATSPKNLVRANPEKAVAVVSTSLVPTGQMIGNKSLSFPNEDGLLKMIRERTVDSVHVDMVGLAEALFDNHMASNIIGVGAAYQKGLLPISAESIESAIKLNGVKVEMNLNAFRAGRLLVADPDWVASIDLQRKGALEAQVKEEPKTHPLIQWIENKGELHRIMAIRVPELIAYQNESYAREYVEFVQRVYEKEQLVCPGSTDLSEAVARYLYKLMAYKDEYEVARLHLKSEVRQVMQEQFGEGAQVHYMLHPPILKKFGLKKKIKFGRWFDTAYRMLVAMRSLRGTAFDPFGRDDIRKTERALIGQYRELMETSLDELSAENYSITTKLANLPDIIRGYDEIKLENVKQFWTAVKRMGYDVPAGQ